MPEYPKESRTRNRIRRAVESRGYAVTSMTWEHGIAGGWTVLLDRPYLPRSFPGDDLFGLSVDEVLASVDYWLKPPEPCGCDLRHDPMTAARLINDPERPTHSDDCRFHITYRLPWWKVRDA